MPVAGGQLILASDINALVGAPVILDTDFPKTSDTTLTATGLSLPLLANSKYWLEMFVGVDANTTADWKYDWTAPAGTTMTHSPWASGPTLGAGVLDGTLFHDRISGLGPVSAGGANAGTVITGRMIGTVRTAGTAGNIVFRFAQNVSNATPSVLKADSMMLVIKG